MMRATATAVRTARRESSRGGDAAAMSAMGRGFNPIPGHRARGQGVERLAYRPGMVEIRGSGGFE
jgi:hypothetical protein